MTESLEMYLEIISRLRDRDRLARVTDIAAALSVSKSSVHVALHELERRHLVRHERYGEVFLTEEGLAASDAVRKRHDTLRDYLRRVLGVSEPVAEEDACRIEHYLSEETMARIAETVGRLPS